MNEALNPSLENKTLDVKQKYENNVDSLEPQATFKFIKNGSIFASKCEYIVNPVNVVGVMGKGLALEFKNNFPKHFEFYKKYCDNGMFDIGGLIRYHEKGRGIFCLPTKKHWRDPSKIGYVGMGLDALARSVVDFHVKSVALPKLGCGEGGLDWEKEVKPLILEKLSPLKDLEVEIYE